MYPELPLKGGNPWESKLLISGPKGLTQEIRFVQLLRKLTIILRNDIMVRELSFIMAPLLDCHIHHHQHHIRLEIQ